MSHLLNATELLIPQESLLNAWSVVACDQYTSEPDYWNRVEETAKGRPSALHIMLPEIYLGDDQEARILAINEMMAEYLTGDVFRRYPDAMIYLERRLGGGKIRRGIIGVVDLEAYDYSAGSVSPIRATEKTVLSRVPPRVHIREKAPLEMPHIMLLINDADKTVFGSLNPSELEKVYDFDLMENGGHSTGYLVQGAKAEQLSGAVDALKGAIRIAVGDGNHSLAAAKACFEAIKAEIGPEKAAVHPARYALAEIVDIRDESLVFEPIHRTVFHVDPKQLLDWLDGQPGEDFAIRAVFGGGERTIRIPANGNSLACGALQTLLDRYVAENGGEVDYIHGDDTACQLGRGDGCVSFLLPVFDKTALFEIVDRDGTLPRKAFSMGHAADKRYYLECREIR